VCIQPCISLHAYGEVRKRREGQKTIRSSAELLQKFHSARMNGEERLILST
jgi:hypothetical protein